LEKKCLKKTFRQHSKKWSAIQLQHQMGQSPNYVRSILKIFALKAIAEIVK